MKKFLLSLIILASSTLTSDAQYYDYEDYTYYQQQLAQEQQQRFVEQNNEWAMQNMRDALRTTCSGGFRYDPRCQ